MTDLPTPGQITVKGGVCGRCGEPYLYRAEGGDPGVHTNVDRCAADRDGTTRTESGLTNY